MRERRDTYVHQERKKEHINICCEKKVWGDHNYWDDIQLIHNALPDINKSDIDTSIKIFGKELSAPIVISPMTGGFPEAKTINENLAKAASEVRIALAVGSERTGLVDKALSDTYSVIRNYDVPLVIGNLGAPQLIPQNDKKPFTLDDARRAMELVDADALAIHLNYLQEVVQVEGDTNAKGVLKAIDAIADKIPVIAKECGSGISRKVAAFLKEVGVKGIDVSGSGGTSWAAVEYYRAEWRGDRTRQRLGKTFWNWGIPSPVSVVLANVGLPIIASGGVRTGLDISRAIAVGASAAGIARHLLKLARKSSNDVIDELTVMIEELKTSMFLVGALKIEQLKEADYVIIGKTREWFNALNLT